MATDQNRAMMAHIQPIQSTDTPVVPPILHLAPKRVFQIMLIISVTLFVVSYIGVVVIHPYTDARNASGVVGQVVKQFDLAVEGNMSSWYSGMILFASAVLLALIASDKHARHDKDRWYWLILAAVFLFLSLDEITFIHEGIGHGLEGSRPSGFGIFKPGWTLAGSIFVIIVGTFFVPFVLHLPAETRRRLIIAAALYLTGALILEIVEGHLYDYFDAQSVVIITMNHIEDVLEQIGIALFIFTLLSYIGTYLNPLRLSVRQ